MFQAFHLIPGLSIEENVALPLRLRGESSTSVRTQAIEMLEKVGMGHRLGHRSHELSGGEQQRVAIARSLVNDPSILLADEPTGNLDSKTGVEIIDLFRKLNQEGLTVILVTHDQDVGRNADRTLVLRDGDIVADTRDFRQALQALHSTAPMAE